jgi:hypothetical protein
MTSDENKAQLQRIGELIRTQDNRATSDPLFLVQQKKRIYGMDSNYCDDYEWLRKHNENEYIEADRIERAGLDELQEQGEDLNGWEKIYYLEIWEFMTICFTEQAAIDYIAANAHNLKEPRIYVASAYRNREMILIREFLKAT